MSVAMLIMLIAVLGVMGGVAVVGFLVGRLQLPKGRPEGDVRHLMDQAERIELLEAELQRLREQADFTEKLLTERSEGPRGSGSDRE